MWLLLVYGTKVTTKVLPRVSFQVAVPGFSRIPTEAWVCSQLPFPSGPGSHRRTCAISPGWTIRLKGPTVQSPAGEMSWWKPEEILHQEQNNSQLAEWPVDRRQLERTEPTWIPASTVAVSQRRVNEQQELEWLTKRGCRISVLENSPGQDQSNWI